MVRHTGDLNGGHYTALVKAPPAAAGATAAAAAAAASAASAAPAATAAPAGAEKAGPTAAFSQLPVGSGGGLVGGAIGEEVWWEMNDAGVGLASAPDSRGAYLLFYQRTEKPIG